MGPPENNVKIVLTKFFLMTEIEKNSGFIPDPAGKLRNPF